MRGFFMQDNQNQTLLTAIFKGTLLRVTCCLICVLVFSAIVKIAMLSSTVIHAGNQFFKIVCLFLACFFVIKDNFGFVKGVLIGFVSTATVHLIFCLLSNSAFFTLTLLFDVVLSVVCGGVFGVMKVNKKA